MREEVREGGLISLTHLLSSSLSLFIKMCYNIHVMHHTELSSNLKTTALLWVMVAGVCAVVANVVAAGMI